MTADAQRVRMHLQMHITLEQVITTTTTARGHVIRTIIRLDLRVQAVLHAHRGLNT